MDDAITVLNWKNSSRNITIKLIGITMDNLFTALIVGGGWYLYHRPVWRPDSLYLQNPQALVLLGG